MPSDADVDGALKKIAADVGADTKTTDCGCPKDCECEVPPGQEPEWSKWRTFEYRSRFKEGNCNYEVIQKVEIRARTFQGDCGGADEDEDGDEGDE